VACYVVWFGDVEVWLVRKERTERVREDGEAGSQESRPIIVPVFCCLLSFIHSSLGHVWILLAFLGFDSYL